MVVLFLGMKWWTAMHAQTPLLPEYNRGFDLMRGWIVQGKTKRTPPGFSREIEYQNLYRTLTDDGFVDQMSMPSRGKDSTLAHWSKNLASYNLYLGGKLKNPPYTDRRTGWRSYFYPYNGSMFQWEGKNYTFQLNPLLRATAGVVKEASSTTFIENTRGFVIEGAVDHRFFFYSRIVETQRHLLPNERAVLEQTKSVPFAGSFKEFTIRPFKDQRAIDFNNSEGYFGYQLSPSFRVQIGQGRHFIGSGYRSLLLSDFGKSYFYGQLDWSFGPVFYRNLYTSMIARTRQDLNHDALLPKKYMATHLLGFNLPFGMQVAFYEAVIHSRNNRFELSYLNPIIFYRSVEFNLGSPDNILIGGDARWDIAHLFTFYGQLMIDEFNLPEIRHFKKGWWGNKFGLQLGLFYPDALGIAHLDLRVEYNTVRPYTYTHRDSIRSYAHYNQPLAHPWGANFKELIFQASYRPTDKWAVRAGWISGCRGLDLPGENNGANILNSHKSGVSQYGNYTCQGDLHKVNILSLDLSYMFLQQYYLDVRLLRRYEMVEDPARPSPGFFYGSIGIRANTGLSTIDY